MSQLATSESAGPSSHGERPTVLIVEDDADIARSLTIRLGISGYRVATAADFQQALRVAGEVDLDAAILDMSIPGGDGLTLLKALRERETTAQLPAIVLTASMKPGLEAKALEAGAQCFMGKPFDSKALLAQLERMTKA